jgi:aryl-alcohol dehydrogenase-like predicted oxidoreductase
VLHAAVESGVTFIDTADVYGDGRSERAIGRFLAGNAGHGVVVGTKMGRRVAQLAESYTLVDEERIAAYGVSVETCDEALAARDRAAGRGHRADHPQPVPPQAA